MFEIMASSSTSPPTLWDVFLSFRGTDTRYTFTDHLYKALHRSGIRAFKDDPELRSGDVISDSLIQAIQDSKAYIVVISENYASSSWCLDELVEILRCYKTTKRLVVPVFYYIDPYVVRRQIESFKEAFDKHQTRYDVEKVNNWRLALNEVADFSGYHISKNRSQADIVDEVVKRVLLEINPVTLNVAKYPVGLDSRVKGVTALFNSNVDAVIRIGIHGMGGVGKTTLAKAVYNQNCKLFQGSCFLANVREASGAEKGVVCLQQQLINDVLKCKNIDIDNVDRGIELIRDRLRSIKVLIVIDDLDDPSLLEFLDGSFAFGSTIIITTRNEDLLDSIKVQARYKVNELDDDQSLQLFSRHAFGVNKIPDTIKELSKEILKRAGGLPLALKVFGSILLNQPEKEWRWLIDKLSRVPIDDIEKKLVISFNALKLAEPYLQDIFLDIACFFTGKQKTAVSRILETCYTFVDRNIDILKKRCMITISDFGILGMHDLLRDMGRKIARNNCPDEPGKHSRLWVSKDIDTVLKNHKGTESIQGIISGYHSYEEYRMNRVTFVAESFKRMSKLKFLYLKNVTLTGSFEQTFEDLRWLRWAFCPLECLPSEFYAEKLVILELPHSNLRTSWKAPQEFKRLKTLIMSGSKELKTTPDFNRLPCLETLDLSYCSSLEEAHVSIGILASLVHLDLRNCIKLRSLPDSICNLRSLEILDITGCTQLKDLPDQLGMITSLRELNVKTTTMLRMLPDINQLSNIKYLDLKGCYHLFSISELPPNLKWVDAVGCTSLKILPNLSNSKQLERLELKNCSGLTEIQGLEELTGLQKLDLSYCSGLTGIHGLEKLTNLEELNLSYCIGLTEIQSLKELTTLEELNLSYCSGLTEIQGLEELTPLRKLNLSYCSGLTEIHGLEELTSLGELNLAGCISSLLACTLTKPFFEILSGFGHKVQISIRHKDFPDWICQPSRVGFGSRMSIDLQPNESHNFLAIILSFVNSGISVYKVTYSVKNIKSGLIWNDNLRTFDLSSIVILPNSILSIRDGDDRIEMIAARDILHGIHLLYKTETTMISEYCSTTDNVQDETSNPLHIDLESTKWLFLGSSCTTVNVGEQRSNPPDYELESNREWLSLGSTSTNHLESNRKWLSLGSTSTNRLKHLECDNNWLSL